MRGREGPRLKPSLVTKKLALGLDSCTHLIITHGASIEVQGGLPAGEGRGWR